MSELSSYSPKKEIKLVVSDLHFGSGKRNDEGAVNLNEDFQEDEMFIDFLEYYSSEEFNEYCIELIFNGDNFEMIDPPWYKEVGEDPMLMDAKLSVSRLKAIWSGHPEIFDKLKVFNSFHNRSIRFLPGNHDQILIFSEVKEWIWQQIGGKVEFSDDFYLDNGIYIEHGQQYTYITWFDPEKKIVRVEEKEILNHDWTTIFSFEYVYSKKVKNFYAPYNITPAIKAIKKGLFFETRFTFQYLLGMIWFLLKTAIFPVRKFLTNSRTTGKIFSELSSDFSPNLENEAKKLLAKKEIQIVIFGHSHRYYFWKDKKGKVYINTGSWTDQTNLTVQNLGKWRKFPFAYLEREDGVLKLVELREWKGIWKPDRKLFSL